MNKVRYHYHAIFGPSILKVLILGFPLCPLLPRFRLLDVRSCRREAADGLSFRTRSHRPRRQKDSVRQLQERPQSRRPKKIDFVPEFRTGGGRSDHQNAASVRSNFGRDCGGGRIASIDATKAGESRGEAER